MTATYTFDVFSTLDGFGSYNSNGDWGGYWGKQGPEFLDHRLAHVRARTSGWSSGPTPSGSSCTCWAASFAESEARPDQHPDEEHADDGGVDDAARTRSTGRTRPS